MRSGWNSTYIEGDEERMMAESRDRERTVWFYRDNQRMNGANLKHSHYLEHVQRTPGFSPKITFGGEPLNEELICDRPLWPTSGVPCWEPGRHDVLFLDGVEDWRYLVKCGLESLPNPRINLIQGFLDLPGVYEPSERERYLAQKAIWICVSQELANEISATGLSRGPIRAIPNGTDFTSNEAAKLRNRSRRYRIVGYKRPCLARGLSQRLRQELKWSRPDVEVIEKIPRCRYFARLAESRVAVCLPFEKEGFYLVALEAMAAGCLVVTLDCIGNRGFCKDGENCLIAKPNPDSLWSAMKTALNMSDPERERLLQGAQETVAEHSLEAERKQFQEILKDVDRLWRMDG